VAVSDDLAEHRKRGRSGRRDLAYDCIEIKPQIRIVFAGELLHALVICEAGHVKVTKTAVASCEERALQQCRSHAMALPWLFNRERGLSLAARWGADGTQLGRPVQYVVHEESVNERIETEGKLGIFA